MISRCSHQRLSAYALSGLLSLIFISTANAQTEELMVVIQPHCIQEDYDDEDELFGEIPDIDPLINLGPGKCYDFEVEDPQTLKTSVYSLGDTVDLDIAIKNPDKEKIKRARVWISYDPTVLRDQDLEVNKDDFPQVTPGEDDFDEDQGYIMVDATANSGSEPDDKRILIANVQFEVIATPDAGTMLSFYDVQPDGHTYVLKSNESGADGVSALSSDPGSLHVIFSVGTGDACTTDDDCQTGSCVAGTCVDSSGLPDGEPCQIDSQCESGNCVNGVCSTEPEDSGKLPNGSECTENAQCQSNYCNNGICSDPAQQPLPDGSACNAASDCESGNCENGVCTQKSQPQSNLPEGSACTADSECASQQCLGGFCVGGTQQQQPTAPQTAFGLLQVQNLRVTTKDTSAFLGWDPLNSSQLKVYNIYYGTTPGQYIQRKTVEKSMNSLTIHNLPTGTTYYFAVRAVSEQNEESAFSNEVYVTIGNPASSSAPLMMDQGVAANLSQDAGTVQGNTGIPSPLVFLILSSAIIGTAFASRRQLKIITTKH